MISINDCVLWTVTCQTVTFLSAESSLNLEPCPNWRKTFFCVCVCFPWQWEAIHAFTLFFKPPLKILEMRCQNLLSITSSRLFSLLQGQKKYKDHQSSSTPQPCVHLFSRPVSLYYVTLGGDIAYFLSRSDSFFIFSAYYFKTDGSLLSPNYPGYVMDIRLSAPLPELNVGILTFL